MVDAVAKIAAVYGVVVVALAWLLAVRNDCAHNRGHQQSQFRTR